MVNIKHLKQTNTAILFAEVNRSKDDMDSMLQVCAGSKSIDSETYKKLSDACMVHSFSEFCKKFDPTVYLITDTNGKFSFSIQPKEHSMPIRLNEDNALISMISTIVETKSEEDIAFD